MRRSRRIIFNALTVPSLVLCVGTVGLWVRSYMVGETLSWFGEGRELCLMSGPGQVDCYRVWASQFRSRPTQFDYHRHIPTGFQGRIDVLKRDSGLWHVGPIAGFAVFAERPMYGELFVEVMTPWWALTLVTAAFPVLRWRWWLKGAGVKPGFCACGYDLRATPERCPECGRMVGSVKT